MPHSVMTKKRLQSRSPSAQGLALVSTCLTRRLEYVLQSWPGALTGNRLTKAKISSEMRAC
ncbi:hypothetical protein CSHISOI_01976 [Colletotrichum shisoi]|uniref:Uncharacterized protein n=1 Tax=Colletotrichum shisoi TaxID=2078593 RepID=A0A5Q4C2G6_9PEZI|nr:hypothetical protein CSHISOI_01976 [Colletotrichum shisoi]